MDFIELTSLDTNKIVVNASQILWLEINMQGLTNVAFSGGVVAVRESIDEIMSLLQTYSKAKG